MIDRKNRYGRTAARIHDADGLARRPSSPTIDIHAHIVIPQAAKLAQPHIDISKNPLARFSNAARSPSPGMSPPGRRSPRMLKFPWDGPYCSMQPLARS